MSELDYIFSVEGRTPEELKADVKELMLELVGEDEPGNPKWHRASYKNIEPKFRNQLRAELREKVKAL